MASRREESPLQGAQEGAMCQPCCHGNPLLLDESTKLKYLT